MDLDALKTQDASQLFATLLKVMAQLRGPKGCPWDKKQTHASLTSCLLEETYEVLAAIDSKEAKHLAEELGDLLLQIVFHSQIAQEHHEFQIDQVLRNLIDKLVRRHPHVFAGEKVERAEEAIQNWEKIKAREKKSDESILSGVPLTLPALLRAYRLGVKAGRVGFDWTDLASVLNKVREELQELNEGMLNNDHENIEEEFGDLLFSLAQASRFLKINPEEALRKCTVKFQKRFEFMERTLKEAKRGLESCQPEELEDLWEQSKSFTASVKNL